MLDTPLKEGLISTLYNVSGIMFSIGLGLIVSFNLSGIRNREYNITESSTKGKRPQFNEMLTFVKKQRERIAVTMG